MRWALWQLNVFPNKLAKLFFVMLSEHRKVFIWGTVDRENQELCMN